MSTETITHTHTDVLHKVQYNIVSYLNIVSIMRWKVVLWSDREDNAGQDTQAPSYSDIVFFVFEQRTQIVLKY